MPNTVPASAEGLPNLNRRSALAKLGLGLAATISLGAASAMAAPTMHPDADLVRLGDKLDAAWREMACAVSEREVENEESEAEEAILKEICGLEAAIYKIPATSLAGIRVKAKLALSANLAPEDAYQLDRPIRDQDWTISCLTQFMADIERLAKEA
jgi:hypothetical protein